MTVVNFYKLTKLTLFCWYFTGYQPNKIIFYIKSLMVKKLPEKNNLI